MLSAACGRTVLTKGASLRAHQRHDAKGLKLLYQRAGVVIVVEVLLKTSCHSGYSVSSP